MNQPNQIREVYIDRTALREDNTEVLDILSAALGAVAIEQVATPDEADAMIVTGGDGAFMHALRRHGFPNVPVTGINTGTLGFYMDTAPTEEAVGAMARQLAIGEYTAKLLPLLEVPVGPEENLEYAANEVVVERASLQAFNASLRLGSGEFEHFVGDGFIFATPQGSTSYSLSAGGPILQEDIEAYVVTPSNPHKSHQYYSLTAPAIVSSQTEAVVTVKDIQKRPFKVSVDGYILDDWPEDECQVKVRVAKDKKLQIIRFDGHDYFAHVSAAFRGKQYL